MKTYAIPRKLWLEICDCTVCISDLAVHDGSQQHIRLVCSVDSSVLAAQWHFSMVVELVAGDDSDAVVAVGVVVGNNHTTADQTIGLLVASTGRCNAEVDTVGGVDSVGSRCSANVHHDSAVDRLVGSCLVPGHLFGSVCYAVECWSVDALWHGVMVVDLMVRAVHGIAPMSAVPVLLLAVAHFFQVVHFFQAFSNAIFLCDLDRFVGSRIVRGDD